MGGKTQRGWIGSTVKGTGRALWGTQSDRLHPDRNGGRIGEIRMCLPMLFSSHIGQVLKRARIRELSYYYNLEK